MANKVVQVKPWKDVYKEYLRDKEPNSELFQLITKISNELEKDDNDYVYCVEFEYGDTILEDGEISITKEKCRVKPSCDNYHSNFEKFKKDLNYTHDPLGIVLTNSIEVCTENKFTFQNSHRDPINYTLPLNIIKSGDLFGLFGTLNYLTGQEKEETYKNNWYVIAGNISFHVAFPYHLKPPKRDIYDKELFFKLGSFHKLKDSAKLKFIRKHTSDENRNIKVLYLPKLYIDELKKHNYPLATILLYKKGWNQSEHLRTAPFENAKIFNQWDCFNHHIDPSQKHLLNTIINYLIRAKQGKELVLKPRFGNTIINSALQNFKELEEGYFKSRSAFEPLPLTYGRLNGDSDWGLLSMRHLPILHSYSISKFSDFTDDLKKIVQSKSDKLPILIGFTRSGGRPYNYYINPIKDTDHDPDNVLQSYLINCFNQYQSKNSLLDPTRINFNSEGLKNLLFLSTE
jgi:hypothetical protein